MARTGFVTLLAIGLAGAGGCGAPQPTEAPAKAESAPAPAPEPKAEPKTEPKAVEPPKGAAHELDQTRHEIPAAPVKGSIAGVDVTPSAVLEGPELTFRVLAAGTQTAERSVRLNLAPLLVAGQAPPPVADRKWAVKIDDLPGPGVPEVWREVAGKGPHWYQSGYALTLELGPRKGGKVAGKISLSLTDAEKTFLAGTFEAAYVRSHAEPPGPDDVPYIGGTVAVTGAKADARVRVSYVGFTGSQILFKDLQLPVNKLADWTREGELGSPQVSVLVAGDGHERPFRYEHVKLTPGRYLLAAGLADGPVAWKWVELAAGGAVTENFALDVTTTGGAEVTVPEGVTGKVHFAPADDPTRPELDVNLFTAVAVHTIRQAGDIVAGRALVKNLAPGKYEVRAGALRGTVEVVAGKTAELKLTPPKKP
jgi:hypothetical protein